MHFIGFWIILHNKTCRPHTEGGSRFEPGTAHAHQMSHVLQRLIPHVYVIYFYIFFFSFSFFRFQKRCSLSFCLSVYLSTSCCFSVCSSLVADQHCEETNSQLQRNSKQKIPPPPPPLLNHKNPEPTYYYPCPTMLLLRTVCQHYYLPRTNSKP